MDKLLLGLLVIVFLYFYLKPGSDYEPTQQEIQNLTYVDRTQYVHFNNYQMENYQVP